MKTRGRGRTDVGLVRARNEDAFLADDGLGLYIVADGMGGHAAGEIAAMLAVNAVCAYVVENSRPEAPAAVIEHMRSALAAANAVVHQRAVSERALGGMGCTLTAVLVADTFAAIAHVGDSRCYISRDGDVQQLTCDHTMVAELVASGTLSAQEAKESGLGHFLSRAIGNKQSVVVDAFGVELEPGDHLLLCSDGLSEHVDSPQWLARALEGDDLDDVAEELVAFANREGGDDNITAVVITVDSDEASSGSASGSGRRRRD